MKRKTVSVTASFLGACLIALGAESGAELFQKALVKERAAGNLEEAIELYQRVARDFRSDRALAARALVQAARCYEKLGQGKATKLYEQVTRDFADQRDSVAMARERLAALAGGAKTKGESGLLTRQIAISPAAVEAQSDGRHLFQKLRGNLVVSGMDGRGERVAFRFAGWNIPSFSVSPDGKQIAFETFTDSRGPGGRGNGLPEKAIFCVVGTDGSGFREVYRKRTVALNQPVRDWSPDGSRLLASVVEPDGSNSLISISVTDGSARTLKNLGPGPQHPLTAKFSPDGRYVAYTLGTDPRSLMPSENVSIFSVDGKYEGKLVEHPSGDRFLNWSADGRYILFLSDNAGTPSIYVLAVADGKPQGQPLLVKRNAGPLQITSMTKDGTLFYSVWTEGGSEVFTVDLDPARGAITSEPQPLSGRFNPRRPFAAWSPDGRRLAYISRQNAGRTTVTIRMLESGQEQEFSLPDSDNFGPDYELSWAPDGSALYAVLRLLESRQDRVEVHSVSTATGAVTRIAVLGKGRYFVTPTKDGNALLISVLDPTSHRAAVIRHDLATGQETELISQQGAFGLIVSPDGTRVAGVVIAADGRGPATLSVKPMEGGDWKGIATFPAGTRGTLEWTADSGYLRILRMGPPNPVLLRISASGGNLEKLGDLPEPAVGDTWAFRVHPNGRQGLFHSNVVRTELWSLENFLPKQPAHK